MYAEKAGIKVGEVVNSGGQSLTYQGDDIFKTASGAIYYYHSDNSLYSYPENAEILLDNVDVLGRVLSIALWLMMAGLAGVQTYKTAKEA